MIRNGASGTYRKVGKTVKQLHWVLLGGIVDVPVIHGSVGNQTQRRLTVPLPIDNVLIHHRRFELLFRPKIEDLNCSALSLERDDVLAPVHDGTVGVDWSPHDLIVVLQVNNNNLRLIIFVELLANADVVVRFEGL